jgi:hypothetical protein
LLPEFRAERPVGAAEGCDLLILVGAAEGCDLLILIFRLKIKRSQPSAAPTVFGGSLAILRAKN